VLDLWAWGQNFSGQFGIDEPNVLVLVQGFKKVRSYPTNYTLSMPLNQISYLAIQQQ
jgi:hypothetical protein